MERAIHSGLRRELGQDRYQRYFNGRTRLAYADGDVLVTVPSAFLAEQIGRRFRDPIRRAAEAAIEGRSDPAEVHVRFRVVRERTGGAPRVTERPSEPGRTPAPARARRGSSVGGRGAPGPKHASLDAYVVGRSNRLAYETACRIADGSTRHEFTRLMVHGGCGVGKTHLLWGIVSRFRELHRAGRALYTTAEAFTNEFVDAVRANRVDALRARYRRLDLLCVDDVHFLPRRRGTQDELLHTLDALECAGARLVLASDAHPRRVSHLSPPLVSRCVSGLVVEIALPEAELCRRLVPALADRHGIRLEPAAADRIARAALEGGASPSVRDLEGLVTRVAACAALLERPAGAVDESMVFRALGSACDPGLVAVRKPVTIEEILVAVCERLSISREEVLGRGRHRRVVLGRELVAHLARRLTSRSYPEIARALGRRSHSTFVQAEHRLRGAMEAGAPLPPGVLCAGDDEKGGLRALVEELSATLARQGRGAYRC